MGVGLSFCDVIVRTSSFGPPAISYSYDSEGDTILGAVLNCCGLLEVCVL